MLPFLVDPNSAAMLNGWGSRKQMG